MRPVAARRGFLTTPIAAHEKPFPLVCTPVEVRGLGDILLSLGDERLPDAYTFSGNMVGDLASIAKALSYANENADLYDDSVYEIGYDKDASEGYRLSVHRERLVPMCFFTLPISRLDPSYTSLFPLEVGTELRSLALRAVKTLSEHQGFLAWNDSPFFEELENIDCSDLGITEELLTEYRQRILSSDIFRHYGETVCGDVIADLEAFIPANDAERVFRDLLLEGSEFMSGSCLDDFGQENYYGSGCPPSYRIVVTCDADDDEHVSDACQSLCDSGYEMNEAVDVMDIYADTPPEEITADSYASSLYDYISRLGRALATLV